MYRLIGNKASRAFRVLWALHEMDLPHEFAVEMPRSDAVRALNPSGKVPVLLVDGVALTDSTAIVTFLADRHGQLTYPAGSIERAQQDGWMQLVLDELDAVLWTAARHSFILPEAMRLPAIKESLRHEFATSLGRVADRLEGPFVMGDAMTTPDIVLAHCLGWAISAKFPVEPPVLQDYLARMRARPAFAAATAA